MNRTTPPFRIAIVFFALLGWLAAPALAQPGADHVRASVVAQRPQASPGDQFAIAVVLEYQPKWHTWPNVRPPLPKALEDLDTFLTEVVLAKDAPAPAGVTAHIAWTQYPEPHEAEVVGAKVLAFSERVVIYVPVVIAPDAKPGKLTLPLQINYQACNDQVCAAPRTDDLPVEIEVVPSGQSVSEQQPDLFKGFSPSVFGKILAGAPPVGVGVAKQSTFDFFGVKFEVASSAYAIILLIAFVAGLLMNFTPCVLPVIPMKVLSLQSHAKAHGGRAAAVGLVYCLGIVTLYAVLGLMAFGLITGGKKFDWGQIFSIPWFVVAMSLVIAIMSLGMIGVFTFRLPNFVYAVNPTGETLAGNFLGGLLTGVLAVPCTGPLLGATLAWILTQPPALGVATYVVMGLGMAAPYALLIAFPQLVKKLPRGGPGSELLKQVMGLFMLAVSAYLASNLVEGQWKWYVVFGVAIAACVWWLAGAVRVLRSASMKGVNAVLAVAGVVVLVGVTASLTKKPPLEWRRFVNDPDAMVTGAIRDAVKSGKVVVIDFTANWCVNCIFIEKNVIYSEVGLAAMKAGDVVAFKVDLTKSGDDQGWGVVREISGGGGIPLIAVFGPGLPQPIFYQSFFKPSDLADAIQKARKG